jgi:hypothetical protein
VKRTLKLVTRDGNPIRIELENRGSGLDQHRRRWVLSEGYWQCVDTEELAQESRLGPFKTSADAAQASDQLHHKLRRAVFLRAGGQCECITPKVRGVLKALTLRCCHVGRCNAVLREPWELRRVDPSGPYDLSNVRAICQACYRNVSGLVRW